MIGDEQHQILNAEKAIENAIEKSINESTRLGKVNGVEKMIKLIPDKDSGIYSIIRRFILKFCSVNHEVCREDYHYKKKLWLDFTGK